MKGIERKRKLEECKERKKWKGKAKECVKGKKIHMTGRRKREREGRRNGRSKGNSDKEGHDIYIEFEEWMKI